MTNVELLEIYGWIRWEQPEFIDKSHCLNAKFLSHNGDICFYVPQMSNSSRDKSIEWVLNTLKNHLIRSLKSMGHEVIPG